MKNIKYILIFVLWFLYADNLQAQTNSLSQKIEYTQNDFRHYMRKEKSYFGVSTFYQFQNFPNAANGSWISMQGIGLDMRIVLYPLLLTIDNRLKDFGKITSPYQIPTFQSAKINKYKYPGGSYSLSTFPPFYIFGLKRVQEYLCPYVGVGYQNSSLVSFDNSSYYRLNLSSWYWKVGYDIYLGNHIPLNLFVEYAHTLNPDKIRNFEWLRIGITFRFMYMKVFSFSPEKSSSKKILIYPAL